MLESVPKEAVFVLSLEQFVGEERGREMPCLHSRRRTQYKQIHENSKEEAKV